MRIDPIIAGLRRDPAPQLRAQEALEAVATRWRSSAEVSAVLDELKAYGQGRALEESSALAGLLGDAALARGWIDGLIAPMSAALAEQPLGQVPFRHQYAQGMLVIQLAGAERAALTLVCYEGQRGDPPMQTVCFAGGERLELCLAGAAQARVFTIQREWSDRAELSVAERRIAAGDTLVFAGPRRTKIVDRPDRRLVLLRASRSDPTPTPAREFRIADGALVHRASGDRAESRDEMAAAVLSAMGRRDAAPVLAKIAREAGSDHFRWQALRHALGLDTEHGFRALSALAADAGDALAGAAGALRASLIERHPVLAQEAGPCPVP